MWFRVDDKLWGSPKWLAIRPTARALWVTAGAWSMDQLTDGHIPAHVVPILGGKPTDAQALVACGLWEEVDGNGYKFHDWHDWQPTRDAVLTKREAEAARKKAWRDKRAADRANGTNVPGDVPPGHTPDTPVASGGTDTGVPTMSRSSRPDPTRPDPTAPKGAIRDGARKRASQLPNTWRPTPEHATRATEDGLDLPREVMKFRAHAEEKGRTAKNWNAAFTRWLMNAAEYQAGRPHLAAVNTPGPWDRLPRAPHTPRDAS